MNGLRELCLFSSLKKTVLLALLALSELCPESPPLSLTYVSHLLLQHLNAPKYDHSDVQKKVLWHPKFLTPHQFLDDRLVTELVSFEMTAERLVSE